MPVVKLRAFVRAAMRQQLLPHELLGNGSVVDPHRISVEALLGRAAQVLHETDVDHEELVVAVIGLRAQRQARSRSRAHPMDHSGPRQQLHGRAQIPRSAVRVDLRVHELASDQACGVQEDPIPVMVMRGAGVRAEIVPERLRDGGLHAGRPRDAADCQVLGDHGWHAAEQQVGAQQADQVLVNGRARAAGERPGSLQRGLLADSRQDSENDTGCMKRGWTRPTGMDIRSASSANSRRDPAPITCSAGMSS